MAGEPWTEERKDAREEVERVVLKVLEAVWVRVKREEARG